MIEIITKEYPNVQKSKSSEELYKFSGELGSFVVRIEEDQPFIDQETEDEEWDELTEAQDDLFDFVLRNMSNVELIGLINNFN